MKNRHLQRRALLLYSLSARIARNSPSTCILLTFFIVSFLPYPQKKSATRNIPPLCIHLHPFLLDWKDFEQAGFNVTKTLENIAEDEFYYFIDEKTGNDSLLLKVIERYSNEVSGYFYLYERLGILADRVKRRNQEYFRKYIELDIPNKLVEYRIKMLNVQKNLLSKKLDLVEKHMGDLQ
jgi:hypothetical protein